MEELRDCLAPAKLNLFLHVVGRRDDGYHLIESVFQLVDLADTLHFKRLAHGRIVRSTPLDVPEETDLCVRAARLLQAETGTGFGVEIEIEKRIPMGGGLGGGSSDAATTLLALNRLWQLGLSRAELMRLGLKLGADVPFFLFGQNAFVRGIGERMTAVPTPPRCFVIVHPDVSVPTAAIFTASELTRDSKSLKISDFSEEAFAIRGPAFKNDLEPVAVMQFPEVGKVLVWLNQTLVQGNPSANRMARMSGSGACVFAEVANREAGEYLLRDLPKEWSGWICKTLSEHPLRAYAEG